MPKQPLPSNIFEQPDESPSLEDPEDISEYRSSLGTLSYVASTSRPEMLYCTTFLSRYSVAPTERSRRLLHQAIRFAKATADASITLKRPDSDTIRLVTYVDAS